VLAALGSIDYWFVTEGRRVHKTVHHYLLRFSGGELCDEDVEVTEVAWVPVEELPIGWPTPMNVGWPRSPGS
jgi:8-oxo-dGTP pyrophosphatase MutT (NUDIX family)